MNREAISTGLWNREAKSGKTYASGKATIGDKEYRITLFTNNDKKNEKSPDYNIIIEEYTNTSSEPKTSHREPKNDIDIYKDFGEQVQLEDDPNFELPF